MSGTTYSLKGISLPEVNTGIAVGARGAILRTTDGGSTWNTETSGTLNTLNGVSFTEANTGTVVGGWGTILRRTKEGQD
jgi:photosystem II stability/assembly factor-like uncharacterized protein